LGEKEAGGTGLRCRKLPGQDPPREVGRIVDAYLKFNVHILGDGEKRIFPIAYLLCYMIE
jgi:hypothetical protein